MYVTVVYACGSSLSSGLSECNWLFDWQIAQAFDDKRRCIDNCNSLIDPSSVPSPSRLSGRGKSSSSLLVSPLLRFDSTTVSSSCLLPSQMWKQ